MKNTDQITWEEAGIVIFGGMLLFMFGCTLVEILLS